MGGKSSPDTPDYRKMAEEQAKASRNITEQQTTANRPDQYTPWGSSTWQKEQEWDPSTEQYINRWQQDIQLTPAEQASLESQQMVGLEKSQLAEHMTGRMWDEYGQSMDWSGITEAGAGPQVTEGNRLDQYGVDTSGLRPGGADVDPSQRYHSAAGDAIYQQATSRLDPQWESAQSDKESQLAAQGLRPGDPAYDRAMNEFDMAKTDAYQQAQYGATMGAGAEAQRYHGMDLTTGAYDQQRRQQQFEEAMTGQGFNNEQIQAMWQADEQQRSQMFGEELAASNYQTQLRQQELVERMQQRGWTLNEIKAILEGGQVGMPTMPGFTTAERSETPQYLAAGEAGYKADLQSASMENAGWEALMGGMGMGAGSAMKISDRRLKRNIERIGTTPGGHALYSWTYVWGEAGVGVMADEVPHAVVRHPSGYDMVDYRRIS